MRRLSRQIVAGVILSGIVAVAACVSIQVEPLTGQIYPPKHKFYTRAMAGIGPSISPCEVSPHHCDESGIGRSRNSASVHHGAGRRKCRRI